MSAQEQHISTKQTTTTHARNAVKGLTDHHQPTAQTATPHSAEQQGHTEQNVERGKYQIPHAPHALTHQEEDSSGLLAAISHAVMAITSMEASAANAQIWNAAQATTAPHAPVRRTLSAINAPTNHHLQAS